MPHLLHVARADEVEDKGQRLLPDLQIGAGQHPQYVHHQVLEDSLVSWNVFQDHQPIENDELDVVVALLDDQINVTLSSCLEEGNRIFKYFLSLLNLSLFLSFSLSLTSLTSSYHTLSLFLSLSPQTFTAVGVEERVTKVPAAS